MLMSGKYGDYITVRFISTQEKTGFEKGQICKATFLKTDPREKWYIIEDRDGEEYAYPREWFEVVE